MIKPVCDVCDIKFQNMQDLSMHMGKVHGETDSMRINRYENLMMPSRYQKPQISIVENLKSSDCTECGVVLKNKEDMTNHIEEYHTVKVESETSDDAESCSDEDDINIEYEYSEQAGTFKGNKPTFVHAVKEIKEFIVKQNGKTKIINKHRFSVKDIKEIEYGLEADVDPPVNRLT